MSCVFPENPPQQFAAESAASDPRAQMAEGLHAMAQPLTILRGALCAVSMKEAVSVEQQRYLEMSARQVTRLSNMLHTLRDVLDLDQSEPECVELDLTALIARAVEEMESTLGESGVTVEMPEIDGPVRAWADPQKTERAVRAVLRVAVAQAAPGAAIRFRASRAGDAIRLEFVDAAGEKKRLGAAEKLDLSVAETNLVNQGGALHVGAEPFHIVLALPIHPPESKSNMHGAEYAIQQGAAQ